MDTTLYALTLINPWPYCITDLDKRVENRSWSPPLSQVGRRIAIHAGKRIVPDEWAGASEIKPDLRRLPLSAVSYSAIVAVVTLAGFVRVEQGEIVQRAGTASRTYNPASDPWFFGPIGWLFEDVVKLPEPIPCRGAQQLWFVQRQMVGQIKRQGVLV
jgi:hypothetical protein